MNATDRKRAGAASALLLALLSLAACGNDGSPTRLDDRTRDQDGRPAPDDDGAHATGDGGEIEGAQDCAGKWGGRAYLDPCGACVGGDTLEVACVQDCAGSWGGHAHRDMSGACVMADTDPVEHDQDCAGRRGAYVDRCGACVGGETGLAPCTQDCGGVWGGAATTDLCGRCDADPSNDVAVCYDVALLFVKEVGQETSFAREEIESRLSEAIDDMVRTNSYHAVGLRTASSSEWYEVDSTQFGGLTAGSLWIDDLAVLAQAADHAVLELSGMEVVVVVVDDPKNKALVRGRALPYETELTIGSATFGRSRQMILLGNAEELLDKQHFYESALYSSDLSLFYDNPCGDNLVTFDALFAHELFHTHDLTSHSLTRVCTDGPVLGVCTDKYYNMFDGLSSSRFFGTSLNAPFREQAGWLTTDRIVHIESSGTYTLRHLNARTGPNAARIEVPGWDQVLWLEYRQPGPFDYGLTHESFASVRGGLLLYADSRLLDASGPGATLDANHQITLQGPPREVAIDDALTISPLGVTIEITSVDPVVTMPMDDSQCAAFERGTAGSITFEVVLTGLTPTHNNPQPMAVPCERGCALEAGGEHTALYEFWVSDIGYGRSRDLPWELELIDLPAGFSYTHTPIQRQYPPPQSNTYSATPHSFITFRAEPAVSPGRYDFVLRARNPADPSKYTDSRQLFDVP